MKALDIPVVAHVPGVGQNLQDHLEIYVVQKCKKPVTLLKDQKFPRMIQVGLQWFYNQTGAAGTTHLESGGFTRSRPGVAHPDIMFHFLPSQVLNAHGMKIYVKNLDFQISKVKTFSCNRVGGCQKIAIGLNIINLRYMS